MRIKLVERVIPTSIRAALRRRCDFTRGFRGNTHCSPIHRARNAKSALHATEISHFLTRRLDRHSAYKVCNPLSRFINDSQAKWQYSP